MVYARTVAVNSTTSTMATISHTIIATAVATVPITNDGQGNEDTMTYKHYQVTRKSYRRDWLVIALLYLSIALMLSTTYFMVKCYIAEGQITKLERSATHEQSNQATVTQP